LIKTNKKSQNTSGSLQVIEWINGNIFSSSYNVLNVKKNKLKVILLLLCWSVLIQAIKEGHWVLLDEINLASNETLERLSSLLEQEHSTFSLTKKGEVCLLRPHVNFRLWILQRILVNKICL
jgi:midasin (ATPase involved in ribosome maturation)